MATTRRKKTKPPKRSVVRTKPNGKDSGLRARELRWRQTHAKQLEKFVGEYVVLEGNRIVAHGVDPGAVANEARARGVAIPYIFFVPPKLPPDTTLLGGV